MFEKLTDLHPLAQEFQLENFPPNTVIDNGMRFLLAMYGAPQSETSIDDYRYISFARSTRLNRPVKLSSLPPTRAAAQQHLNRVYYQVQVWLGNNLQPEQWGWVFKNNKLEPITTLLPPAPDELINTIFCNCRKGCSANCGCRKVGLQCSIVCSNCRGISCLNPSEKIIESNDFDEQYECDGIDILTSNEAEINNDDNDDDPETELGPPEIEDEEEC